MRGCTRAPSMPVWWEFSGGTVPRWKAILCSRKGCTDPAQNEERGLREAWATVERGKPRGMHPRSNLAKVGGVCVSRTGSKEKRYTCSHGDRTRLSQTWRSLPRASHNHGDTLQPQRRCFKYPQTPGRAKGSRHRPGRGKGGISPARRE